MSFAELTRIGTRTLLVAAIGLCLVVDAALPAALALLVLVGVGSIIASRARGQPSAPPADREIKLIGFSMAFFALAGLLSWALQGLPTDRLPSLANHLQLLFFWPLFVLFTRSRLGDATALWATLAFSLFTALGILIPLATADVATAPAGSPGMNLALLGAMLLVLMGAYAFQTRRPVILVLSSAAALGLAGVYGIASRAPLDAAPTGSTGWIAPMPFRAPLDVLAWVLLLAIPFVQFGRYCRHDNPRVAYLATAGALVPLAYLAFGLTGTHLEQGPYLGFYLLVITLLARLTWQAMEEALHRSRHQRLSATIITCNEADNIGNCLESLAPVADEIIVLDSGSSDDTVAIARRYTTNVEVTDWPGFGIQKQRALERATGDWVLSIDADERVTPYLAREINHVLGAEPDADAYKLPWAVTIYGKRLDFGRSARAPLRLFRRQGARFTDARVHETIVMPEGARIKTLRGRLTHYTHRDFGHALAKSAQYAWLGAQQRAEKGRRTRTLLYPTVRAITTFVQVYIIRLGFLDGPVGYLMAIIYAQSSFNTFAGLWTLRRQAHKRHDEL